MAVDSCIRVYLRIHTRVPQCAMRQYRPISRYWWEQSIAITWVKESKSIMIQFMLLHRFTNGPIYILYLRCDVWNSWLSLIHSSAVFGLSICLSRYRAQVGDGWCYVVWNDGCLCEVMFFCNTYEKISMPAIGKANRIPVMTRRVASPPFWPNKISVSSLSPTMMVRSGIKLTLERYYQHHDQPSRYLHLLCLDAI